MTQQLVILGCGYVGSRIARAALAAGRPVRVCGRSTGKLAKLGELGAEVKYVDVTNQKQLTLSLASVGGGTVVCSVPPAPGGAPGRTMRMVLQAAYGGGANCFVYFSSSGLYGAGPDDDVWVDEETPLAIDDPPQANVVADELEIEQCRFDRLRPVTLRLAPVYGPGRGVRARLRKGDYKLLDEGQHAISRIHVDDVVNVVFAAEERAAAKAKYLVADNEPTTQLVYATWLCERMGIPLPPSRSMFEPGAPRVSHRNRKIRNTKVLTELGVTLKYPTFREGEAAIEAEEAPPSAG